MSKFNVAKDISLCKKRSLSESLQKFDIRYTLVNRNEDGSFVVLTPEMNCRDFISDALLSINKEVKIDGIYGFKFDGSLYKGDSLELVITRYEKDLEEEFDFDELGEQVEADIDYQILLLPYYLPGVEEVTYLSDKEVYIKLDNNYLKNPTLTHAATGLIRLLASGNGLVDTEEAFRMDSKTLDLFDEINIELITKLYNNPTPFNYIEIDSNFSFYRFHDTSGISSFLSHRKYTYGYPLSSYYKYIFSIA